MPVPHANTRDNVGVLRSLPECIAEVPNQYLSVGMMTQKKQQRRMQKKRQQQQHQHAHRPVASLKSVG